MNTWFRTLWKKWKKKQPIDSWQFEIVFDDTELINFLRYSKPLQSTKDTARKIGLALENAYRYFEATVFDCFEDGTLKIGGRVKKLPLHKVEVKLFEFGNFSGLYRLNKLESHSKQSGSESYFEGEGWRIHGHIKSNPSNIVVLGFDRKGFFLSDRRESAQVIERIRGMSLPPPPKQYRRIFGLLKPKH